MHLPDSANNREVALVVSFDRFSFPFGVLPVCRQVALSVVQISFACLMYFNYETDRRQSSRP